MELVMFEDVVEHVTRVARTISQPRGNAMILGAEGVGRRSISRLAAYLSGIFLFEINSSKECTLNAWRSSLKTVLMTVGLENK
jgi:dynein heavy chain, axonemal